MRVVFGCGISGLAAAQLLQAKNESVILTDDKMPSPETLAKFQANQLVFIPFSHLSPCETYVEIIVSPGVDFRHPWIANAKAKGVAITSEITLALRYYTGSILSVTGTNGKSTTVMMMAHILRKEGFSVKAAGNIGVPLSLVVQETPPPKVIVLELSSYQLHWSAPIPSQVALFCNFSYDHMGQHQTEKNYFLAKCKIFESPYPNFVGIITSEIQTLAKKWGVHLFPSVRNPQQAKRASGIPLDRRRCPDGRDGLGMTESASPLTMDSSPVLQVIHPDTISPQNLKEAHILEPHNQKNALYAATACAIFLQKSTALLLQHLQNFAYLPHRFERIGKVHNALVINDSKSTTVASTLCALESAPGPCMLFLGGVGKNEPFSPLLAYKEKIITLYTFGTTGPQIAQDLSVCNPIACTTLKEALRTCFAHPLPTEGTILFSPGCASLDEFSHFEARGDFFIAAIQPFLTERKERTAS